MLDENIGHWIKSENLEEFGDFDKEYFGFVYKITLSSGYWYIGSKQFNSKKKLKPLKGRVNARRKIVESDWKVILDFFSDSNNFCLGGNFIKKQIK